MLQQFLEYRLDGDFSRSPISKVGPIRQPLQVAEFAQETGSFQIFSKCCEVSSFVTCACRR